VADSGTGSKGKSEAAKVRTRGLSGFSGYFWRLNPVSAFSCCRALCGNTRVTVSNRSAGSVRTPTAAQPAVTTAAFRAKVDGRLQVLAQTVLSEKAQTRTVISEIK
jgi:hypothetical protein